MGAKGIYFPAPYFRDMFKLCLVDSGLCIRKISIQKNSDSKYLVLEEEHVSSLENESVFSYM